MSYIDPYEMSDRQLWAVGSLAEKFYQAGNLETVSDERDQEAATFLKEAGYEDAEIAPLVGHMNACVGVIQDLSPAARQEMVSQIELSIKEGRHRPPAPAL